MLLNVTINLSYPAPEEHWLAPLKLSPEILVLIWIVCAAAWLAHASIAGGVHLNDQLHYNLLITSDTKPLAQYFNEAGYRTVRAMPDTQWPWPEGEYYKF
jgi:hypothetical protein